MSRFRRWARENQDQSIPLIIGAVVIGGASAFVALMFLTVWSR